MLNIASHSFTSIKMLRRTTQRIEASTVMTGSVAVRPLSCSLMPGKKSLSQREISKDGLVKLSEA